MADTALRQLASSVLDMVIRPNDNELYDLWPTSETRERWLQDLDVYRTMLGMKRQDPA